MGGQACQDLRDSGGSQMRSMVLEDLPSGEHTKNYGKTPFLIGKSTINPID